MPRARAALSFCIPILFVSVISAIPAISHAEGTIADQMCTPFYPECGCGMKPNPDKGKPNQPDCIKGANTHGCGVGICFDDTNDHITKGICEAEKKCKGILCDGQPCPGKPDQPKNQGTPAKPPSPGSTQGGASPNQPNLTPSTPESNSTPAGTNTIKPGVSIWDQLNAGVTPPQGSGGDVQNSFGNMFEPPSSAYPNVQEGGFPAVPPGQEFRLQPDGFPPDTTSPTVTPAPTGEPPQPQLIPPAPQDPAQPGLLARAWDGLTTAAAEVGSAISSAGQDLWSGATEMAKAAADSLTDLVPATPAETVAQRFGDTWATPNETVAQRFGEWSPTAAEASQNFISLLNPSTVLSGGTGVESGANLFSTDTATAQTFEGSASGPVQMPTAFTPGDPVRMEPTELAFNDRWAGAEGLPPAISQPNVTATPPSALGVTLTGTLTGAVIGAGFGLLTVGPVGMIGGGLFGALAGAVAVQPIGTGVPTEIVTTQLVPASEVPDLPPAPWEQTPPTPPEQTPPAAEPASEPKLAETTLPEPVTPKAEQTKIAEATPTDKPAAEPARPAEPAPTSRPAEPAAKPAEPATEPAPTPKPAEPAAQPAESKSEPAPTSKPTEPKAEPAPAEKPAFQSPTQWQPQLPAQKPASGADVGPASTPPVGSPQPQSPAQRPTSEPSGGAPASQPEPSSGSPAPAGTPPGGSTSAPSSPAAPSTPGPSQLAKLEPLKWDPLKPVAPIAQLPTINAGSPASPGGSGESSQNPYTPSTQFDPQSSPQVVKNLGNYKLSAYSAGAGGQEGPETTAIRNTSGTYTPSSVEEFVAGKKPYVTAAVRDTSLYGKYGKTTISYKDSAGVQHNNVEVVVRFEDYCGGCDQKQIDVNVTNKSQMGSYAKNYTVTNSKGKVIARGVTAFLNNQNFSQKSFPVAQVTGGVSAAPAVAQMQPSAPVPVPVKATTGDSTAANANVAQKAYPSLIPVFPKAPASALNRIFRDTQDLKGEDRAARIVKDMYNNSSMRSTQLDYASALVAAGLTNTPTFEGTRTEIAKQIGRRKLDGDVTASDIQKANVVIAKVTAQLMKQNGVDEMRSKAAPSKTGDPVKDAVNKKLWDAYLRTDSKKDSGGDFTWKDIAAALRKGMSYGDYVIGGMDPDLKLKLATLGDALDAANIPWQITSGFRDDYRQSIAEGYKAEVGHSQHGGSKVTAGYGHGMAVDIAGVYPDGASDSQKGTTNEAVWKFIDKNGRMFGLERPIAEADPPHVQPVIGKNEQNLLAQLRSNIAAQSSSSLAKTPSLPTADWNPNNGAPSENRTGAAPYGTLRGSDLRAADNKIQQEFIQRMKDKGYDVQVKVNPNAVFYKQAQSYEKPIAPVTRFVSHVTESKAGFNADAQQMNTVQDRGECKGSACGTTFVVENCKVGLCRVAITAPFDQRTNHVSGAPNNRLKTAGDYYNWNTMGIEIAAPNEASVTDAAADTLAEIVRTYGEVSGQRDMSRNVAPHYVINPKSPGEGTKGTAAAKSQEQDNAYQPLWQQLSNSSAPPVTPAQSGATATPANEPTNGEVPSPGDLVPVLNDRAEAPQPTLLEKLTNWLDKTFSIGAEAKGGQPLGDWVGDEARAEIKNKQTQIDAIEKNISKLENDIKTLTTKNSAVRSDRNEAVRAGDAATRAYDAGDSALQQQETAKSKAAFDGLINRAKEIADNPAVPEANRQAVEAARKDSIKKENTLSTEIANAGIAGMMKHGGTPQSYRKYIEGLAATLKVANNTLVNASDAALKATRNSLSTLQSQKSELQNQIAELAKPPALAPTLVPVSASMDGTKVAPSTGQAGIPVNPPAPKTEPAPTGGTRLPVFDVTALQTASASGSGIASPASFNDRWRALNQWQQGGWTSMTASQFFPSPAPTPASAQPSSIQLPVFDINAVMTPQTSSGAPERPATFEERWNALNAPQLPAWTGLISPQFQPSSNTPAPSAPSAPLPVSVSASTPPPTPAPEPGTTPPSVKPAAEPPAPPKPVAEPPAEPKPVQKPEPPTPKKQEQIPIPRPRPQTAPQPTPTSAPQQSIGSTLRSLPSSLFSALASLLSALFGNNSNSQQQTSTPSPQTQSGSTTPQLQKPSQPPLSATLVANPGAVALNGSSLLAWSSVGASMCSISLPDGSILRQDAVSGTISTGKLSATTVYTLICSNTAGQAASSTANVLVR